MSETLLLLSGAAIANGALYLSGTSTNGPPTALNVSINGGVSYTAAVNFISQAGTADVPWACTGPILVAGTYSVVVQDANATSVLSNTLPVVVGSDTLTFANAPPLVGTITQFVPRQYGAFQFTAALSGPTSSVSSTGSQFTITVPWNAYAQRYYVTITDQNGDLVLNRPLVASPPGYPISMTAGYFATLLTYDDAAQQFTVST